MIPNWLSVLSYLYVIAGVVSGLAVVISIVRHPQKMGIMNVVWPITALYFGPFGWWCYRALGLPKTKEHKDFASGSEQHSNKKQNSPEWRSVFLSTTHCGGGCSFGDFLGEWAIFLIGFTWFGSKLFTAYTVDFILACAFGILFQYFAIAPMKHLGLRDGIKEAIKADTLSLVAFEVGMFGWMAIVQEVFFQPRLEPNSMVYWLMMEVGMLLGFATSYPANWLLIKKGIKHGMGAAESTHGGAMAA